MKYLLIFFILLNSVSVAQSFNSKISGIVFNSTTKSPLSDCNILIPEIHEGTVTDSSGNFMIYLPYGTYLLKVSYVGFKSFEKMITLSENNNRVELKIYLEPLAIESDEVTVSGDRKITATTVQEIEEKDLQKMPTLFNDVLRAVQVLPGVISNNELSSGYNVRGGNFDDNLIYLNGFEIYRPFLLRQGVEENQTLINPDLTNEFRFYNGSFPASYGDKMSSALEVNYNIKNVDQFSGKFRADFLNSGLTIKNEIGDLKFAAASRYAYPGLFLNALRTNGEYKPHFADIQLIANYTLNDNSEAETFLLYANNKFDLTPTDWVGSFGGFQREDIRQLQIFYDGERTYSFKSGVAGIKYSSQLNKDILLKFSGAFYSTVEDEKSLVNSESYYLPDAANNSYKEYLKSGNENVDNYLEIKTYEIVPQVYIRNGSHLFTGGLNFRLTDVKNQLNEQFTETGDSVVNDFPFDRNINQNFALNSYSAFVMDDLSISDNFFVNAGIRGTYYQYNEEFLISPRINGNYILSPFHNFSFSWGYYFQPPYYAELRNKEDVSQNKLKAQRAIHYSAGWEYRFKEKLNFNAEIYYKNLFNLIPHYVDREKTEYLNENSNEGFAYGFDLMVQGEIVEGMNSWIGYGYLNTQERIAGSGEAYHRRLTDNNHSVQIFLQDRIKKHPNWQSHFRLLFNSGYVFNLRRIVTDEQSGERYIQVSFDEVRDYPAMYFRVDMGLSANFDFGNYNFTVIAEVLNLFNHRNSGGYRFVQVSKDIPSPFAIPQILSSRFLNVGIELKL